MPRDFKRGFNRLFLVVALSWAAFWGILYPLHYQLHGRQEAYAEYNKGNKNCDTLVQERPEWDMTKDCYQRVEENYRNTLELYSFSRFWMFPVALWRIFLPLIVVPPAVLYGLALVAVWVRNGFKIVRNTESPPERM